MVHFIPTIEKTSAEGLARLFRDNMWKLHGLPESIITLCCLGLSSYSSTIFNALV